MSHFFELSLLFSILLGAVFAQSQPLIPIYECYNPTDPVCHVFFGLQNCNSVSTTYNAIARDATNTVLYNFTSLTATPGYFPKNSGICLAFPAGSTYTAPVTLTVYTSGGALSAQWNGCTDSSTTCSPAGSNCYLRNSFLPAPTCPTITAAPTTAAPVVCNAGCTCTC